MHIQLYDIVESIYTISCNVNKIVLNSLSLFIVIIKQCIKIFGVYWLKDMNRLRNFLTHWNIICTQSISLRYLGIIILGRVVHLSIAVNIITVGNWINVWSRRCTVFRVHLDGTVIDCEHSVASSSVVLP